MLTIRPTPAEYYENNKFIFFNFYFEAKGKIFASLLSSVGIFTNLKIIEVKNFRQKIEAELYESSSINPQIFIL